MTPAARAFWGAMLGALLTLALHPASRPFILGSASRLHAENLSNSLDISASSLKPPKDLLGASLWLQIAFEKVAERRQKLTDQELASVLSICNAAIEREQPQNAYWHQAKAALLMQDGRRGEALDAWMRASRYELWKDYQTERLEQSQQLLAHDTGARQAWQYAYIYYARTDAGAKLIERTARTLLATADYTSAKGRALRFASLKNGESLRLGGRSILVSNHGANIVELSAYPPNLTGTLSPKRLWIGRTELLASLAKAGPAGDYEKANQIFQYNDGWVALVNDANFRNMADQLSLAAVVAAQAPVAAIAIMILGGVIYLLGCLVSRTQRERTKFGTGLVAVTMVAGSAVVYALTGNVAAAMAVGLSTAFLLVGPAKPRHVEPSDLGPLFTFVILVMSGSSALALGTYVIASSGPAVALASAIGLPPDYSERPALAGLSAVFLALIFIAAPLWALVHRLSTPHVVSVGLRRAGAITGLGGLLLVVLLSPVCVYADRTLTETLSSIAGNEPVYHLTRYESGT